MEEDRDLDRVLGKVQKEKLIAENTHTQEAETQQWLDIRNARFHDAVSHCAGAISPCVCLLSVLSWPEQKQITRKNTQSLYFEEGNQESEKTKVIKLEF